MHKVTILISGTGTNMKSILDYEKSHEDCPFTVFKVISDREAKGLKTASSYGVETVELDRKSADFSEKLEKAIAGSDFLVLAGYLSILPEKITEMLRNRIINIHPSLLPLHGGVGMYGLNVHKDVLKCKDKESGCTCHIVDSGVDSGEILIQKKVCVMPDDTPESLRNRILPFEHEAIVEGLLKLIKRWEEK